MSAAATSAASAPTAESVSPSPAVANPVSTAVSPPSEPSLLARLQAKKASAASIAADCSLPPASPRPSPPSSASSSPSSRARPFVKGDDSAYKSLWKKPSPALRGRSLLRNGAVTASLPPFHFFASSPASDTSSAASDADSSAWPASPSAFLPSHLAYSAAVGLSPLSSPRSGFTSPSLSPGPNIRRLAEQFLNSLPDDSPMTANRSLASSAGSNGKPAATSSHRAGTLANGTAASTAAQTGHNDQADSMPVSYEPSDDSEGWQRLHNELVRFYEVCQHDQQRNQSLRDDLLARTRWSIRAVWPTAEVDLVGSVAAGVALPKSDLDFVISFDATRETPKMYSYTTGQAGGPLPELPFIVLEDQAEKAGDGAQESALPLEREDKEAMVGSPLYSSVATASPLSTTSTISNASTSSSFSHLSHASFSSSSSSCSSASSFVLSPTNSASRPPSTTTSPTLPTASLTSPPASQARPLHHYFAHAGTLIKLIGGRKKSKLLFRSTKIQVFKDINLIRLRDGCSGVSMDLWFPSERAVVGRSQRHVEEVKGYLVRWRWMGVLAAVIKTFMQQQLLNSGYSGLGSYGVLLMIVRYLQVDGGQRRRARRSHRKGAEEADAETSEADADHARHDEEEDGEVDSDGAAVPTAAQGDGEPNVGRLLCGFFRYWAEFDYVSHGVDVRGDGSFIEKPQINYSQRKAARTGPNGIGGADSDDDEQHVQSAQSAQDTTLDDVDSDGTLSGKRGRRPVVSSDRLSLVIVDPCDSTNHIVCHQKALRNMIAAFMQAVAVLDPTAPPVVPAPEVRGLADWEDLLPTATLASAAISATSSISASAAASAIGSTASTAPASPLTSKPSSAAATPVSTTRTSPNLHSASVPPLTPSPPLKLQQDVPMLAIAPTRQQQKSRFHRLLDFNQARLGPSMKLCPSPACQFPDGTVTQCPVQNKVCYSCGHTFVKPNGNGNSATNNTAAPSVHQKQRDSMHGHEGKGNTSRRGRGKGHKAHPVHSPAIGAARMPPSIAAQPSSGYSPPLNKVMANGTIANTNGMKFVHAPPAASPATKPLVPSITPAAAAGGFVYINSPPLAMAVGGPAVPPPFSLSMPVSPYYPAAAAVGAGYYGGYDGAYPYAPYAQPAVMQSNGPGAAAGGGKRFNGARGGRGGGGGRPFAGPMMQPTYYDPTAAAAAGPYMAHSGYYPPAPSQAPHQAAYFVPAAAMSHTMPVGRY